MAITIKNLQLLNVYIKGVLERSEHHAEDVSEIVLALAGAVIWKTTNDIEVREYNGSPANMLWFYVNDKKYALSYKHSTYEIILSSRSFKGKIISKFTNESTIKEIKEVFSSL